jgi:membrane associated rhomboid family serine protease
MIPLKDHIPTRRVAIVVPLLIAINAFVFLFVQKPFAGEIEQTKFFICEAAIPYEVTHGELLSEAPPGELDSPTAHAFASFQARTCPNKNVWLSIVASMFMHGGWLHIIGNMLFLFVFGNNVEDELGRFSFVAFYLASGVAATYTQSFLQPGSFVPMIGASGAVAGVLGAYILLHPRARVTTLIMFIFITVAELPAAVVLGLWFLLQIFQSVGSVAGDAGGVAYFAHIGGFVAGMLLLMLFRPSRPQRPEYVYDD